MATHKFDNTSDHDWGVIIFAGYVFEWRIEYRSTDGTGVSPDPAHPERPSESSPSTPSATSWQGADLNAVLGVLLHHVLQE